MTVLDDQILAMEKRLDELMPYVREARTLERAIYKLRQEAARDSETGSSHGPGDITRYHQMQEHQRLPERQNQIEAYLVKAPDATNREIAEALGLSAARIGQIRKTMK